MTKICLKCNLEKDISEFRKYRPDKNWLQSYCKDCAKLARNEWIKNNLEKRRKTSKDYILNHAEELKKYHEAYMKTPKGIFGTYKRSAKLKSIVFELVLDDFIAWFNKTNCFYCGKHIDTIGIDRVNSDYSIGYIRSNIVPCCTYCNLMKRNLSQEEFIKHINLIFKNLCEVAL